MTVWLAGAGVVLVACMPGPQATDPSPESDVGPVRLSTAEVEAANEDAGCTAFATEGGTLAANHVGEDAPPASELYDERPPTDGDHLGRWTEARVHRDAPDERAVVHNHEHGAVSVWYDGLDDEAVAALEAWAEARNADLANDAGAGVIVAPFEDGLAGDATVAFRAWTGGLDCQRFDRVVADGFLLERFGQAPEGNLAPPLTGVVDPATTA